MQGLFCVEIKERLKNAKIKGVHQKQQVELKAKSLKRLNFFSKLLI